MSHSRADRYRLPATASVLLAMVCALLLALCAPASADFSPSSTDGTGTVVTAQGKSTGCGRGPLKFTDDRGAHPLAPSRSAAAEQPTAPCGTVCADSALDDSPLCAVRSPDRGPPPLAPPTPVDLSVLRV
ncbi:hypothetical protein [Streptomyces sp. NBC_00690]|uniref:hypothetical protein n=1 Tax=Streptomyces sp. NBC_00690 TaxID=2975808 RepID=UPI002E2D49B0|nr:hypothetical protein [Streptomyces sp. NBC_00690]